MLLPAIHIVQLVSFVDVPSSPHGVTITDLSQTTAKILFNKPESHGGVPIHHYQVDVKEVASETWKIVRSHGVQSELFISLYTESSTLISHIPLWLTPHSSSFLYSSCNGAGQP